MITTTEAFAKFKTRLELTDTEQKDVSRRHTRVREVIRDAFALEADFLTGSYGRKTKTKPLKDVDVFCVLDAKKEGRYLKEPSANLLEAFRKVLADEYGEDFVSTGRRSVQVRFGIKEEESEGKVLSIDVVPSYADGDNYIIADPQNSEEWVKTNPEIHAKQATAANKAFNGEWVPLVKMLKRWNNVQGKPIKPSFLVEVMAQNLLNPPFSGGYIYELKGFFANAALHIRDIWNDPAGLGSPVSDEMDESKCRVAEQKLKEAERYVSTSIQLGKQGQNGESLRIWREHIFGDLFPLS